MTDIRARRGGGWRRRTKRRRGSGSARDEAGSVGGWRRGGCRRTKRGWCAAAGEARSSIGGAVSEGVESVAVVVAPKMYVRAKYEYLRGVASQIVTLHNCEILHIQRYVPCEIGVVRVERLPSAHRLGGGALGNSRGTRSLRASLHSGGTLSVKLADSKCGDARRYNIAADQLLNFEVQESQVADANFNAARAQCVVALLSRFQWAAAEEARCGDQRCRCFISTC